MKLPETSDLLLPMLELMQDGNEYHLQDISKKLAQRFEFSSTGEIKDRTLDAQFYSRVVGARSYMTQARLLESTRRGVSKISDRGHELLAEGPRSLTIKSLVRYPEFLDYLKTSTSENLQDYVSVVPTQKSTIPNELNGNATSATNGSGTAESTAELEHTFDLSEISILNDNQEKQSTQNGSAGDENETPIEAEPKNEEVIEVATAEAPVEPEAPHDEELLEEEEAETEAQAEVETNADDNESTVVPQLVDVEVVEEPVLEEPIVEEIAAPETEQELAEDIDDQASDDQTLTEVANQIVESTSIETEAEIEQEAQLEESAEEDEEIEPVETTEQETVDEQTFEAAVVEDPVFEDPFPATEEPVVNEPVLETSAEGIDDMDEETSFEEDENQVFQWIEPNEDPVLVEESTEFEPELENEIEPSLSNIAEPIENNHLFEEVTHHTEEDGIKAIKMNNNVQEPVSEHVDDFESNDSAEESLNNVTEIPESDFKSETVAPAEPVNVVTDLTKTQDSIPVYREDDPIEPESESLDIKEIKPDQPESEPEPESQVVPYSSKPAAAQLSNHAVPDTPNEGITSLIQLINQIQTASQANQEYQLQQPTIQGRQEERLSPGMFTMLAVMRFLENWFQHFWLYTIPLVLMIAAYGASFYILSDEFVSKGVLFVDTDTLIDQVASIGEDNVDFFLSPSEQTADEITELLNTDSFIRLIISQTPTLETEMAKGDTIVRETIVNVREAIAVNITGSNNVEIAAAWDDQETAWKTAEATLNSYIEWKINSDKRDSSAAREFLENLVPQYENEWRATVQSLEEFLINNPEPFRGERPEIEQLRINQLEIDSQTAFDRFQAASQDLEEIRLQEFIIEGKTRQAYTIVDTPKIPVEEEGGLLRKIITGVVFITLGIVLSLLAIVASTLVDRSIRFPIESPSAIGLPVLSSVEKISNFDQLSGEGSG